VAGPGEVWQGVVGRVGAWRDLRRKKKNEGEKKKKGGKKRRKKKSAGKRLEKYLREVK
jgi:hypothetical protein